MMALHVTNPPRVVQARPSAGLIPRAVETTLDDTADPGPADPHTNKQRGQAKRFSDA